MVNSTGMVKWCYYFEQAKRFQVTYFQKFCIVFNKVLSRTTVTDMITF